MEPGVRPDLELEYELEELIASLPQNELEAEAGWEAQVAGKIVPLGRCTPTGTRVGDFVCQPSDLVNIVQLLAAPVSIADLRAAVEASAGRAVSLATRAASTLDIPNRNRTSRVAFCAAFGVPPDFVPPWRATLHGKVNWRDLGELVAIRLRDVAKILDGGCIRYFSWGRSTHCPECTADPPSYFACSSFQGKYIICLGRPFWQAWHAGDTLNTDMTILHEPLHIYFRTNVADKGRTGNAGCYESYVTRVLGLPIPAVTTALCPTKACTPLPPIVLDGFDTDKHNLKPFHTVPIQQIAQTVVDSWKTPTPILIVQLTGFADSTGRPAPNVVLGNDRAIAVQEGIKAAIRTLDARVLPKVAFMPLSQGAQNPVAPNTTRAGRTRNRRVEVVFLPS
jgi:hypothetical protein